MPIINQGLTKLKNLNKFEAIETLSNDVVERCRNDFSFPDLDVQKLMIDHRDAAEEFNRIAHAPFVNKNYTHIIAPIVNLVSKLNDITTEITRGDGKKFQSLLKGLKEEKARGLVNNLKYELNKPAEKRLDIVSNLYEMSMVKNSKEYTEAQKKYLETLAKLYPSNNTTKGLKILTSTDKTSYITMIDAIFDRFRISKNYSEFD